MTSPLVGFSLLSFFAQSCSTVRVLLAHFPAVREVLGSVNNYNERSYLWTIDSHVGKDSGGMHAAEGAHVCNFSGHCVGRGARTVWKALKRSSGSFKYELFEKAWGAAGAALWTRDMYHAPRANPRAIQMSGRRANAKERTTPPTGAGGESKDVDKERGLRVFLFVAGSLSKW